jgi:hypothetical protein
MHGWNGPGDFDYVGVGADWFWNCRTAASIPTSGEPTVSMPIFHNYGPRIAPFIHVFS